MMIIRKTENYWALRNAKKIKNLLLGDESDIAEMHEIKNRYIQKNDLHRLNIAFAIVANYGVTIESDYARIWKIKN